MIKVNKNNIWVKWEESSRYKEGYIFQYNVELQAYIEDKGWSSIGMAEVLITNEKWIQSKEKLSLVEHIHHDYWELFQVEEIQPVQFLEDNLLSIAYGAGNGTNGTLAFINKIQIYKEYRGNGLFPVYFESILDRCRKMNVDIVSLQPYPFVDDINYEEISDRVFQLRTFYSRFGFVDFPTNRSMCHMVLTLNEQKESKEDSELEHLIASL